MSPQLVFILISSLFSALLLFECRAYYYGKLSKNWPNTNGTILDVYVDTQDDMDNDDVHSPVVEYAYRVAGKRYISSRLCFGSAESYDYSEASGNLVGISKNTKVTVYYDPSKPSRSVLHTGTGQVKPFLALAYCLMYFAFLKFS